MITAAGQPDADLMGRARDIHRRVLTLDTHNDIEPAHFTSACNCTMRLTTQVNLPKMRDGGLDVPALKARTSLSRDSTAPAANRNRQDLHVN